MTTPSSWSELPADVFLLVSSHFDALDLIRSSAVCTSWNLFLRTYRRRRGVPLPWLMLSSGVFFSLHDRKTYRIRPSADHTPACIGSSASGFLLSPSDDTHLIAANPLTGSRILFPSISADADLAVLSPTAVAAVAFRQQNPPSFARPGDASWTALRCPDLRFTDALFHKGRLHAISILGESAVFDLDRPSDPPFLPRRRELVQGNFSRFLVESPDGAHLFQVVRYLSCQFGSTRTLFKVFKLNDETTYEWKEVHSLGDLVFFLHFKGSFSVSVVAHDDDVGSNCIYFLSDPFLDCFSSAAPESAGSPLGVFNLLDGSSRRISIGSDVGRFNWLLCLWLPVPSLSLL